MKTASYAEEVNRKLLRRVEKEAAAGQHRINCAFCPPNRGENASISSRKRNHGQQPRKRWARTH